MSESLQPSGRDDSLLDRLFGTVEEIEAENAKRKALRAAHNREVMIRVTDRPETRESNAQHVAGQLILQYAADEERYESD